MSDVLRLPTLHSDRLTAPDPWKRIREHLAGPQLIEHVFMPSTKHLQAVGAHTATDKPETRIVELHDIS